MHVHNPAKSMTISKKVDSNLIGKTIDHAETILEEPHVEPNDETYVPTSFKP